METRPFQCLKTREDSINEVDALMCQTTCKEEQPEMAYERNNKRSECPGAVFGGVDELREKHHDDYDESLEYRCPGTMDILSGRMVPCSAAPTLREIALGRRMRRTVVDAPECQPAKETRVPRRSKTRRAERNDEKNDGCNCEWSQNNSKNRGRMCQEKPEPCCAPKKKMANQGRCMSCCGGGASRNGTFPKWYEGGCNCGRDQRHTEESGGCCELETTRYRSGGHRETTPRGPTGGCGRHGCPGIAYPPSEPTELKWEYTNYNRNNHRWPTAVIENYYPVHEDDCINEKQDYQSDKYEEFEREENMQDNCGACYDEYKEIDYPMEYQQLNERFGGGCDGYGEDGQSYWDYYYENEPVDYQKPNEERVLQSCRKCSESRSMTYSDNDDNRRRRRVHF